MDTNGAVLFLIFTNELVLAHIILTGVYSFTLFSPIKVSGRRKAASESQD